MTERGDRALGPALSVAHRPGGWWHRQRTEAPRVLRQLSVAAPREQIADSGAPILKRSLGAR
jgi:hypothetical protein